MFSLIVTIIAVILTAGIAIATLYYGGPNINSSSARALAEQLVTAGEHITAAGALYQNDHAGNLPASPSAGLAPAYLSALPVPSQAAYAKGAGTAAATDWAYLSGTANVILPKLSKTACQAVNALYGLSSIPANINTHYLIQCFGVQEPYTFYFDPPGGNIHQAAAATATPVVLSLSVTSGNTSGNTQTYINGDGFQPGAQVYFGSNQASGVTVTNTQQIAVYTPASTSAGPVTVKVVNTNGNSGVLANAFTYQALPGYQLLFVQEQTFGYNMSGNISSMGFVTDCSSSYIMANNGAVISGSTAHLTYGATQYICIPTDSAHPGEPNDYSYFSMALSYNPYTQSIPLYGLSKSWTLTITLGGYPDYDYSLSFSGG